MTGGDLVPVADQLRYAETLAESNLLPPAFRGRSANVVVALGYGQMLGIPPMAALTGIVVIDGKPALSAALMAALVRRAGHSLRIAADADGVTATIVRVDDPGFTYSARWDRDRADQAGLTGKDNYQKHPGPMFAARAITEVARQACQDVIYGLHSPEELGAEVTVDDESEIVPVHDPAPSAGATSARRLPRSMVPREPETEPADHWPEPGSQHDRDVVIDGVRRVPASPAQLAKMGAIFGDLGVTERAQRLTYTSTVIGRQIGSAAELTTTEASTLIDQLEQDRAAYLDRQTAAAAEREAEAGLAPGESHDVAEDVPGW